MSQNLSSAAVVIGALSTDKGKLIVLYERQDKRCILYVYIQYTSVYLTCDVDA